MCIRDRAMREAYQVMANRFDYTGEVVNGVQYIRGNLGCPYDCTEGEGYALLAAAYMGDRETFNGLWMRVHDHFMIYDAHYSDGIVPCPNFRFGKYTMAEGCNLGAAADGDWDIGLALLVATKQWGSNSGVTVADGMGGTKTMDYLEEAYKMIGSLADTTLVSNGAGPNGYMSGSIGLDGYPKGGNMQDEATDWAYLNGDLTGPVFHPAAEPICGGGYGTNCGSENSFASYIAPAYYYSFAEFLDTDTRYAFAEEQFRRAYASTYWLMEENYDQGRLPYAGGFKPDGANLTFFDVDPAQGKSDGEAFRMPWRTIIDYMWRGEGTYQWDPVNHTYTTGVSNTAMIDNANNLATYIKDPGTCGTLGASPNPLSNTVNHSGISQVNQNILGNGVGDGQYWTNYSLGTASPSAVAVGDQQLLADLYRQLELKWDDQDVALTGEPPVTDSEPKYFHGWFRLLGMTVLTGNHHAPENMLASANMKVYMDVNKTFAFTGDEIEYEVEYRNYGVVDAEDVEIRIPIDDQYEVVDFPAGSSMDGDDLVVTIGTVVGFQTSQGLVDLINETSHPTRGTFTFSVIVTEPKVTDKVCLQATISASNDDNTWTSNEYPNNRTYTMERNCVDILANRALNISKTANRTGVNPGDNVEFTLEFSNSSDAGFLSGGRSHVNFSYGYGQAGPNTYFHTFRNWNNAEEAYIDLSNYRASYYMFDNVNKGIYSASGTGVSDCESGGCLESTTGWSLVGKNLQTGLEGDESGFVFCAQEIPVLDDGDNGKVDQRIIMQFPDDITAPTHTVLSHTGNRFQLHKGTLEPIWYEVKMESNPPLPLFTGRVDDDWSFMGTEFSAGPSGVGSAPYFLIGPNYADNTVAPIYMDRFDRDACTAFFTPDEIYTNILIEEWDGYTWRRIAGEGPLPGREMTDVVILDTIPDEFEFVQFLDDEADGETAELIIGSGGEEIIRWTKCRVLVGTEGCLLYTSPSPRDGATSRMPSSA